MKSDLVDLELILVHETAKAILVRQTEDGKAVWLPKEPIEIAPKSRNVVIVTMPERLAIEKGLV